MSTIFLDDCTCLIGCKLFGNQIYQRIT